MAFGPYRKKTSQDWANRTDERLGFEAFLKNPERSGYWIDQDRPPPTPEQQERYLDRCRALQHWHTHPIAQPFEPWYYVGWPQVRPKPEK